MLFSNGNQSRPDEASYQALAGDAEGAGPMKHSQTPKRARLTNWAVTFGAIASPILLFVLVLQQAIGDSNWQMYSKPSSTSFVDVRSPEVQKAFLDPPEPWNYESYSPCGHTIENARQAGCKWSAMAFTWSPPECYDDELEQAFLDHRNWTWYSTEELLPGTELDRDRVIRGDEPNAAMDAFFHNVHCIFTLKKIQRSLLGVALANNYMLRYDHAKHCEKYLMEDYESIHSGGTIHPEIVLGKAKYLDCVRTG